MKSFIVKLLATGFGAGYEPRMPGTAGTVLAALLYWFLLSRNSLAYFIVTVLALVISVPVSTAAEKLFGGHDDKRIVIDEAVGLWAGLLFLPRSIFFLSAGFVIFRILDIRKPLFISASQNLPGGMGIVADDLCAGILTNLILHGVKLLI